MAEVLGVRNGRVTFRLEEGGTLTLIARAIRNCAIIDRAWCSTVHAFQGRTVDNVIAAMEANHPKLTTQKSFYVEISRARDRAELVTEDAAALREQLEAVTGEQISALEGIGEAAQPGHEKAAKALPGMESPSRDNSLHSLPEAGTWSATGSLSHARGDHFAVRLADGRVLVSGGQFLGSPDDEGKRAIEVLSSAEIYDPGAGTWTPAAGMTAPRQRHSGVLLPNGRAIVAGGDGGDGALASVETYDPASDTWEEAAPMANERSFPVAFSLQGGGVLVMGGAGGSAEIFDPASGSWSSTGSLSTRVTQAATAILADGRVLVAAGFGPQGGLRTVEVYDPTTGTWTMAQQVRRKRIGPTATLLPSGRALLVGGRTSTTLLFDATALNWSPAGKLAEDRRGHTATLLGDGTVLIAGGEGRDSAILATTEIYTP